MKEATLNLKIEQVNEVVSEMKAAGSVVVVNVIGLTVAQTMDLRKQLYANGCSLKVVKNMNQSGLQLWNDYYPAEEFKSLIEQDKLYLLY